MTEITISLQEDRAEALRKAAARLGLAPEELARASLEDLLARPDEAVDQAINRVISKNRELYRRLA